MTLIVGHRGAAGTAPENTLPGFRKAVELGVRLIELDVRLTRDGVLVCFHDDRLDRLTPESGPLGERDWASLAEVPVLPGAFDGAYPDARIPLLGDVLTQMPSDCRFLVELKPDPERGAQLVRSTLEVLGKAGVAERCRLISFDQALLRIVRAEAAGCALGVLTGVRDQDALLERAREVTAEAVHPDHRSLDAAFVQAAKDAGFLVSTWTVNNGEELRRLAALGADEIASDYPDLAPGGL